MKNAAQEFKILIKQGEDGDTSIEQRREGCVYYRAEVKLGRWDGKEESVIVEIEEKEIIVVWSQVVFKRLKLLDLSILRISDQNESTQLKFSFGDLELRLVFPNIYSRDRLLSAVLTMRSLLIPSKDFLDHLALLLDSTPFDPSQLLLSSDPLSINQRPQHLLDYESMLLKHLNHSHPSLFDDIILNCTFASLILKPDQLPPLRAFLARFQQSLTAYQQGKDSQQHKYVLVKEINVLSVLLNCKGVFTEIGEWSEILKGLARLVIDDSYDRYMQVVASQAVKQVIQHYSKQEVSIEYKHKKVMIEDGLFTRVKEFILESNSKELDALSVYGVGHVLRSILNVRKTSTKKDEYKILCDMIFEDDPKYSQLGIQAEDPLQNKHIFHILERLILFGDQHFEIQYISNLILTECLWYLRWYEPDTNLPLVQSYLLSYSTIFLWHLNSLQPCQSESITHPSSRSLSISLLSSLLYRNEEYHALLLRCYPFAAESSPLFNSNNQLTSMEWTDREWDERFFSKFTSAQQDFTQSPIEHWDSETRQELQNSIQNEIDKYREAVKIQRAVILGEYESESLVLPNHEYNREKKIVSRAINIRWNYKEFKVEYKSLQGLQQVGKYYLVKLLVENRERQELPKFACDISDPKEFFEDLQITFMSTYEVEKQILILKCLCVLYRIYFKTIGPIYILPYFMQLLCEDEFSHCHFYILNLIHVSLSINETLIKKKNIKKFFKHFGLTILSDQLSLPISPDSKLSTPLTNFTNSLSCCTYFTRNTEPISRALLGLKLLQLLLTHQPSLDTIPLPPARTYLHSTQTLSLLTHLLTLTEEQDLSHVLIAFIYNQCNYHYFFFLLKTSGMIELMLLHINKYDKALKILERFQEVAFDYNSSLSSNAPSGTFSGNDLKLILEDREQFSFKENDLKQQITSRRSQVISESILLRFFPVAMVKYLYEKGLSEFLKVYRTNKKYETTIVIWSPDMRERLENEIRSHFDQLMMKEEGGCDLVQSNKDLSSQFEEITDKRFMQIIRYPEIENEVRCGRYYLRVWVDQKKSAQQDAQENQSFFDIPANEEEDFHRNIQTELKHSIYEDQLCNHQRLIILFKSCLLALQRFKNKKRLTAKYELKRIILDLCRSTSYTQNLKIIIYLGVKVFYHFIQENAIEMKEYLAKLTIEIVTEVLEMVLRNAEIERGGFDRREVKIITMCMWSCIKILQTEVQAFSDVDVKLRVKLIHQISKIMSLNLKLIPLLEDKDLSYSYIKHQENQNNPVQSSKNSTAFDPQYASPEKPAEKKQNRPKQNLKTTHQPSSQSSSHHSSPSSKKGPTKRVRPQKSQTLTDDSTPLLKLAPDDSYSFHLFTELMCSLAKSVKFLSQTPALHCELLEAGLPWKLLLTLYFHLKQHKLIECNNNKDMKVCLRMSTVSLKNLVTYSAAASQSSASSGFEEQRFWERIQKLLSKKVINSILRQDFSIKAGVMNFTNDYNPKIFLSWFGVRDIESSEVVWNDETRLEMHQAVEREIESGDGISGFEYSVQRRELRVEEIYIRHYNDDRDKYRPQNALKFAIAIIKKIKEYVNGNLMAELKEEHVQHVLLLVKAFKTLLLREPELKIKNQDGTFQYFIDNLCSLITLSKEKADSEIQNISNLSEVILDILTFMTLTSTAYISFLKSMDSFVRFLIRSFYCEEKVVVSSERLIYILQVILSSKELKPEHFLNSQGLLFFLLDLIFTKENALDLRIEAMRILLHTSISTEQLYGSYLPTQFFLEYFCRHRDIYLGQHLASLHLCHPLHSSSIYQPTLQQLELSRAEREMLTRFFKDQFDVGANDGDEQAVFESVFLVWDGPLRSEQHSRVRENCEQVVKSYYHDGEDDYEAVLDIAKMQNPMLEREIRVKDVILRVYNRNPAVFIKEKLNTFIHEISKETHQVACELLKLRQTSSNEFKHQDSFKVLHQKSTLLLTALLLSLEQLVHNDQNPNRLLSSKDQDSSSASVPSKLMFKTLLEKSTDQTHLVKEVFTLMGIWMQQQVFTTPPYMQAEVRLTFLQIIYIVIDVSEAVKTFIEDQTINQFVIDSVTAITDNKIPTQIEEIMILMIVNKLIIKDVQVLPLLTAKTVSSIAQLPTQGFEDQTEKLMKNTENPDSVVQQSPQSSTQNLTFLSDLFQIFSAKKMTQSPHTKLIILIIQRMQLDAQYIWYIKSSIKSLSSKFKIDLKLFEENQQQFEQMINTLWRSSMRPIKQRQSLDANGGNGSSSKKQNLQQSSRPKYEFDECQKIEDVHNSQQHLVDLEKIRLPLISKNCLNVVIYGPGALREYEERKERLSEETRLPKRSATVKMKQMKNKEALGFDPILDDLNEIEENVGPDRPRTTTLGNRKF